MGIVIANPQPLRTAPGLATWLRYTGQEYLIFLDESFRFFFELTNERGYFCHGAFGVPASEYEALKKDIAAIFQEYRRLLVPELKEFEHTEFRRIPFPDRKRLATDLHSAMKQRGGFIEGYYTPAEAFILERVREDVMDELDAVPADYSAIRERIIEHAKEQWNGPGKSDVISQLLLFPFSGLAHMLAGINCTFRIIYDPREGKEDRAVQAYIDGFGAALHRLTPSIEGRYRGWERERRSEEELGLQLADLVAGETRDFFDANVEFRSFGASPRLITQESDEAIYTLQRQFDRIWKFGAVTRMPDDLQRRFFEDDSQGHYVLPEFTDLLASGVLICYSTWGTPRYVIVGHLVDSASNNHQRFVRAQSQDDLVFEEYAQDVWVAAQRYQDAPWRELVTLWSHFNRHLARVMVAVPDAVRTRKHTRHNLHQVAWQPVPEAQPATLDYFMHDYVHHLEHHLRQILGARWSA